MSFCISNVIWPPWLLPSRRVAHDASVKVQRVHSPFKTGKHKPSSYLLICNRMSLLVDNRSWIIPPSTQPWRWLTVERSQGAVCVARQLSAPSRWRIWDFSDSVKSAVGSIFLSWEMEISSTLKANFCWFTVILPSLCYLISHPQYWTVCSQALSQLPKVNLFLNLSILRS